MAIEPEITPLFDFLCEHSPSKSRVMALIGPYDGPRYITAVLTCKDKDHAYQAVQLLAARWPPATPPSSRKTHGHGPRSLRNMARPCGHNVLPALRKPWGG